MIKVIIGIIIWTCVVALILGSGWKDAEEQ